LLLLKAMKLTPKIVQKAGLLSMKAIKLIPIAMQQTKRIAIKLAATREGGSLLLFCTLFVCFSCVVWFGVVHPMAYSKCKSLSCLLAVGAHNK